MKTEKKKSTLSKVTYFLIIFLLGAICGSLGAVFMTRTFKNKDSLFSFIFLMAVVLLSIYIAVFIQIVAHELGHLIFGLASGYKFASFRVGSLLFLKKGGRLKCKKYSLMGTGGQCLLIPPPMVNGKIPYVLYNLGGVLMNIFLSALCIGLTFFTAGIDILSAFLWIVSIMGIALALMNGIPMNTGALDNDGKNIISIGKNPEAMRCLWLQMMIYSKNVENIRLKDMPEQWFIIPSDENLKNSLCAAIGLYACNRAMDQMDFTRAKEIISRLLDEDKGLVGIHRNMLISEQIYCELVGENRDDVVDACFTGDFKKFLKAMKNNPSVLRMQYAYELLGKRHVDEADKISTKFEKIARSYPFTADIESERDLMTYARKIFEDRLYSS